MDGAKFFKLMGDSGLAGKAMSRTDCDLIFTKTCSTSGCVKKIHYDAFRKVRPWFRLPSACSGSS